MKSLFEKYKWLRIVLGVIILAAGVVATILAINGTSHLPLILSIIIAVCCFVYAALIITASFIKNTRTPYPQEVFVGGILIGIGATLCIEAVANSLFVYSIYLLASGLIAVGAVAIVKGIVIACYKDPVQNWLFMLIGGVIALVGGILIAIFRNDLADAIKILIGITIVIVGLLTIVIGIVEVIKGKKAKSE